MKGLYYNDGKLFEDKELTMSVSSDNPAYEILKKIKIPSYLTDVVVYEQTYDESLNRLIFVGSDSKGKRQYFYGKLHVKQRNDNRNNIFVNVYGVIDNINRFIDGNITSKKKNDTNFQLAVLMLMETSFFIRMGKMRYLKENKTVGLITLKNENIIVNNDKILIKFTGKDKVVHEFVVYESNRLYNPLLNLVNEKNPNGFLFNKLSEKKVYEFMRKFNIRIKDLRTYGVNYTFLYNFWSNVKSINPLPNTKKLISMTIKQTAEIVGHTPSISKNAYMANTVIDLLQKSDILKTIREIDFNEFMNLVIGYVKNKKII
ncbi:77R [Yaba monkey tumor virus]|uniref:DNA topoisomerase n=1 Tax=Yaba monkey tumor virus (strain VR587) TaxID=928314 RepID=Q6TUT8_YMTV5|nr:DNA topoisomerase type I [Yaba monkey tumor virus]AAR07433.1 77R [Yaba monkey tumor virus]